MLHTDGRVFVEQLVETFDVSEVSIRKDLAVLEERKLLVRVKGGAIILHQSGDFDDMSISSKQRLHAREKQLIGKYAASMIHDGDRIILDSGTTTMEIAKNLDNFNHLTIITNALDIAITLNNYNRFTVIVLGGTMRSVSHSTVGMYSESALKNIFCDKLFLGVDSISIKDGLSTPSLEEASLNQAMIGAAKEASPFSIPANSDAGLLRTSPRSTRSRPLSPTATSRPNSGITSKNPTSSCIPWTLTNNLSQQWQKRNTTGCSTPSSP